MESGRPQRDPAKCVLCGKCVGACPCRAIEMTEQGPVFHCPDECPHVGVCVAGDCWCLCEEVCPEGAIECPFEIVFEPGT